MRQLPPLEPSYDPILIRTNRRLDLQSLINVLYQSILRRDASRASKAWSILVRCPEVDIRNCWQWPLAVLDLQEREALRASRGQDDQASQDAVRDVRHTKETFLRRMLIKVVPRRGPEVLLELVLHLIYVGKYQTALDDLELWLTTPPYDGSPILHVYAGLLVLYLAQPLDLRTRRSERNVQPVHRARSRSRSSSSSTSRRSRSPANADSLASKLDRRRLFTSHRYFEMASEIAEKQGHEGGKCEIAEVYKQRVEKYLQAGDDNDDMDTHSSISLHDSELEEAARASFSDSVTTDTLERRSDRPRSGDLVSNRSPVPPRSSWMDMSGSDKEDYSSSEPDARMPTRQTFSKSQSQSLGGIGLHLQAMAIDSQAGRPRPAPLVDGDKEEEPEDEDDSEMNKSEYSDDLSVG